jgi:hypothetical protein
MASLTLADIARRTMPGDGEKKVAKKWKSRMVKPRPIRPRSERWYGSHPLAK